MFSKFLLHVTFTYKFAKYKIYEKQKIQHILRRNLLLYCRIKTLYNISERQNIKIVWGYFFPKLINTNKPIKMQENKYELHEIMCIGY